MEFEAIYGQAFTGTLPLVDSIRAPIFMRGTTFSTGDARVNWGGGAFTNVQNLPTHIENGFFAFSLTAAEMEHDRIGYQLSRNSHGVWFDQAALIRTINTVGAAIPAFVATFGQMPRVNVADAGVLNDVSNSSYSIPTSIVIEARGDAALASYDGPTRTEATSDKDEILAETGEIGTAGAGLSNINLPNQTMDIIGDITGNLSGSVGSVAGHTPQTADHKAILATINARAILVHADTDELQQDDVPGLIGALNDLAVADIDAVMANLLPSNFTNMGIESDGHVHGDLKQWLGVAPNAINNGAVEADVQRWLDVVPLALVSQRPQVDVRAMINSVENQIADHVHRRHWGNITDGDTEDDRSMMGMMAQHVNLVATTAGNLKVFRDDDATVFATKAVKQTAGAEPIIEINP